VGGAHGLEIREPMVLGGEDRAVREVAHVDEPDGHAASLDLGADALDERWRAARSAQLDALWQRLEARAVRAVAGLAKREQVAVGVVRVEDRQLGRLRGVD